MREKQYTSICTMVVLGYYKSEKKKSVLGGGGPATSPLGISTISPDKS